jgi:hypothetical protein
MSIATACPGCRAPFRVPERLAGKKIRCKICREEFRVGKDDDFEDYDDEPRPRRRKKKGGPPIWVFIAGGALASFCAAGAG